MTTEPTLGVAPGDAIAHAFGTLGRGSAAPRWVRDQIVDAWGLDPAGTTVTTLSISKNATFLIASRGAPTAVARIARPGYMDDTGAVESEVAWVGALASSGVVRVPCIVPSTESSGVAMLADDEETVWSCVTYAYAPGGRLDDVTDPRPYYRRIGRTAALLHDHAVRWSRPPAFVRPSWELADMVGPDSRWGSWQAATLATAERTVLVEAQRVALDTLIGTSRAPDAWGLVHADLRPANLLLDGDDLTVIDFDDCGFTWFLYDFAAALSFVEHLPTAESMAKDWLDGYADVRPLSSADERIGCALSMVRRLQMLGWTATHRTDAVSPEARESLAWGTVEVAERYLRSATWLLD